MEINRNNYEAYLLDLVEGRLTGRQKEELQDFLRNNPDCPVPDPDLVVLRLEAGEIRYPSRDLLKKEIPLDPSEIDGSDFDFLSIARLEGDLGIAGIAEHDSLIRKDAEKKKEWEVWKKARLTAPAVSYPDREGLKRKTGILREIIFSRVTGLGKSLLSPAGLRFGAVAAAAAIILFFIIVTPGEFLSIPEGQEEPAGGMVAGSEPRISGDPVAVMPEQDPSVDPAEQGQARLSDSASLSERSRLPGGEKTRFSQGQAMTRESHVSGESRPGALSIKKKQDPPELTGTPGRLRMAALVSQPAPLPGKEIYDRIKPLSLPPQQANRPGISLTRIAELDMDEVFENITGEQELSFWSVANSGIKGINRITGTEMSLYANRDEDGELSEIEFKSRIFSFSRSMDRED